MNNFLKKSLPLKIDLIEIIHINIHFIFRTHYRSHVDNIWFVFSVYPQIVLFVLIGVSVSYGKCKIY